MPPPETRADTAALLRRLHDQCEPLLAAALRAVASDLAERHERAHGLPAGAAAARAAEYLRGRLLGLRVLVSADRPASARVLALMDGAWHVAHEARGREFPSALGTVAAEVLTAMLARLSSAEQGRVKAAWTSGAEVVLAADADWSATVLLCAPGAEPLPVCRLAMGPGQAH